MRCGSLGFPHWAHATRLLSLTTRSLILLPLRACECFLFGNGAMVNYIIFNPLDITFCIH